MHPFHRLLRWTAYSHDAFDVGNGSQKHDANMSVHLCTSCDRAVIIFAIIAVASTYVVHHRLHLDLDSYYRIVWWTAKSQSLPHLRDGHLYVIAELDLLRQAQQLRGSRVRTGKKQNALSLTIGQSGYMKRTLHCIIR